MKLSVTHVVILATVLLALGGFSNPASAEPLFSDNFEDRVQDQAVIGHNWTWYDQWFAEDGLNRSFFTSGGSESVESCLRLARQYHKVRGEHGRTKFFSLKLGYHGTHFGGASVNGNNRFRTAYEPLLAGCFHMPCPYPYRNPFNESDPQKLAQLCLQITEDEINFQVPETMAALLWSQSLVPVALSYPMRAL